MLEVEPTVVYKSSLNGMRRRKQSTSGTSAEFGVGCVWGFLHKFCRTGVPTVVKADASTLCYL